MTDHPDDRRTHPERPLKPLTVDNYDALGLDYPEALSEDFQIRRVETDGLSDSEG